VAKPAAAASPADLEKEKALWDGIKDSKVASDFNYYLEQYPSGIYADLAKSRLAGLGEGAPRAQPVQPAQPDVQQPAAAAVAPSPEPEPEPVVEPVSTAPVTDDIQRDSNGVDCRIMDATRSASDCRGVNKGGGGGGGYGSGKSKSGGSQRWQ
jgi:carboxyl-terminal processing protease